MQDIRHEALSDHRSSLGNLLVHAAASGAARPASPRPAAAPAPAPAPAAEPAAPRRSRRGFAAMDKGRQRQIASLGGRAAHERGQAHEFTPDEAREAGRKGGQKVSSDRDHMAAIGRKGGVARGIRMNLRMRQAEAQDSREAAI